MSVSRAIAEITIAGEVWHFTQPLSDHAAGMLWAFSCPRPNPFSMAASARSDRLLDALEFFGGFTYLLPHRLWRRSSFLPAGNSASRRDPILFSSPRGRENLYLIGAHLDGAAGDVRSSVRRDEALVASVRTAPAGTVITFQPRQPEQDRCKHLGLEFQFRVRDLESHLHSARG